MNKYVYNYIFHIYHKIYILTKGGNMSIYVLSYIYMHVLSVFDSRVKKIMSLNVNKFQIICDLEYLSL